MRLIDPDALCKLANSNITKSVDANDIMRFPTIDAVPVKHGHWIVENEYKRFCTILQCSECGKCTFGYPNDNKYCYNCGALMDEVTKWD